MKVNLMTPRLPVSIRLIVCGTMCTAFALNADDGEQKSKATKGPPSVTWTWVVPEDLSPDQYCDFAWRIPKASKEADQKRVVTPGETFFQTTEIDLRHLKGGEHVAISVWFENASSDLTPLRFVLETTGKEGALRRAEGTLSIPKGFTNLYSFMPSGPIDGSWFLMISEPLKTRNTQSAFLELGYENR